MLKKNYRKKGQICRVTFKYPNEEKKEVKDVHPNKF